MSLSKTGNKKLNSVCSLIAAIVCAAALLLLSGRGWAEDGMPLENQADVPPGTVINVENFPKYANYFPESYKWLFTDKYFHFWKLRPWQKMIVGSPLKVNIPRSYFQDTEQYSSQVGLKQTPEGGWTITNYEAGLPFPHPSGPQAGIQVVWNEWYRFAPARTGGTPTIFGGTFVEDAYLNAHYTGATYPLYQRLAHLSDPPLPRYRMNPFDFAEYIEIIAPEQAKYTTQMILFYLDPDRVQENWSFSPSLRRVLRLSSAARCAPTVGLDILVEDSRVGYNGQTNTFDAKLVAHKKVLVMTNMDLSKLPQYNAGTANPADDPKQQQVGLPGAPWYPSDWGTWQPREVYVVDLKKVPAYLPGYCYANRRMYVDAETWALLTDDLYDISGKPWKLLTNAFARCHMPKNHDEFYLGQAGGVSSAAYDFQNNHVSFTEAATCATDEEWPERFWDLKRYASPAGLAEVMR